MRTKENYSVSSMTIKPVKPPRTEWETTEEKKVRYLKRKITEKEAKRALDEYYKLPEEFSLYYDRKPI